MNRYDIIRFTRFPCGKECCLIKMKIEWFESIQDDVTRVHLGSGRVMDAHVPEADFIRLLVERPSKSEAYTRSRVSGSNRSEARDSERSE